MAREEEEEVEEEEEEEEEEISIFFCASCKRARFLWCVSSSVLVVVC